MTNNQDARPFVDLKKDAEEFRTKFDEDIKECINFLDAKITALICDPDSVRGSTRDVRQNALVDFSKAKYDIFISVKSLINKKEREWLDYMSEMKKLFVENVEIFLAGTKLEVKLPSDGQFPNPRKSPGNRKSMSMASYIVNNIAKNIPVLSSPLQNKDTSKDTSNVGNKVQSNRGISFSTKVASSPSTSATVYLNDNIYSSKSFANEEKMDEDEVQSNRSRKLSIKLNKPQSVDDSVYKNESTESSESSESEVKIEVQPSRRGRGRGRQTAASIKLAKSRRVTQKDIEMDTDESRHVPPARNPIPDKKSTRTTRGRQGKQSVKNLMLDDELEVAASEDSGESSASEQTDILESKNHSDETEEEVNTVETSSYRGCKGRGARSKINDSKDIHENNNHSDETEEEENTVETSYQVKGRRGTRSKINGSKAIETAKVKVHRGRPAVQKISENSDSDKSVPVKTTRRRRGVKNEACESETSDMNKNVTFDAEADIHDNLDPGTRNAKFVTSRKSWKTALEDMSADVIVPQTPTRTISKRKTISGTSEIESAATPSKRLKLSNRKSIASLPVDSNAAANDNLLESDGNYSQWVALKNIDGKVSTHPAIYEMKVWRAKKSAFIGCCESFRETLTLYKLKQNSGRKQLDKFVERNYDDIQIRYELVSSVADAKDEVKSRIASFVAQYKTTPAYN